MATIQGLNETIANLAHFAKVSTRNRIARKAVTKAAQLVYKAGRANMTHEDRTKALRKSYGYKVKTYEGVVVGVIGARGNYQTTWTSPSGRVYPVNPIYYDHLVEQGHGGPHPARAYPHLAPAWQQTKQPAAAIFAKTVEDAVQKEWASYIRKTYGG